ncbi:hypothetical protein [Nonomuraea dietziae]|uniref:hypothetical protein n=1 Tax=Nonomuraea dietziae TaxID=65515 RepID=UPI0031DAF9A9
MRRTALRRWWPGDYERAPRGDLAAIRRDPQPRYALYRHVQASRSIAPHEDIGSVTM